MKKWQITFLIMAKNWFTKVFIDPLVGIWSNLLDGIIKEQDPEGGVSRDDEGNLDIKENPSTGNSFWDSVLGNGFSLFNQFTGAGLTGAQIEQNKFNAEQAAIQRGYEERLSNTAYQRGVADMQSAGLNPALMYGSGAASATPSGAVASGVSPTSQGGAVLGFMSQLMQMRIQEKLANAEVGLKGAQQNKIEAEIPWIDRLNSVTEKQGLESVENLKRERALMDADYDLKIRQAITEEERILLTKAQTALTHASENQIEVLLNYNRLYLEAKTDNERAECDLRKLQYMYNQGLWSQDYIDAIRKYAIEHAENEEMSKEIARASKDILSGKWIDTEGMSKAEKAIANVLNLFMATNAAFKR